MREARSPARTLRAVAVAALLALSAALACLGPGSREEAPAPRPEPPRREPAPSRPPPLPERLRNVFEFEEAAAEAGREPLPPPTATPAPALPSPTPAVRLLGFLRKGDVVSAILSVEGEILVVAPGGAAGRFTVLGADEEEGARLRAPDGSELLLGP